MVYSQICSWLQDQIDTDEAPEELLDTWDLTEWLYESEIMEIFNEVVLPVFKLKKTREDATQIVTSLIWEYYLLRRAEAVSRIVPDSTNYERLKTTIASKQQSLEWHTEKRNMLTASEFHAALGDNAARLVLINDKVKQRMTCGRAEVIQTVSLTPKSGKLNAQAWGHRFESVVRDIYAKHVAGGEVYSDIHRIRHDHLEHLAASPDGIVTSGARAGRLVEIKAPISRDLEEDIIPYEYYCQTQIQMEVCNIGAVDYCECRIFSGENFRTAVDISDVCVSICSEIPSYVGSVAVVGNLANSLSWRYVYSPLFPDTSDGRADAKAWLPCLIDMDDNTVLEKHVWQIADWQVITSVRNKRWWNNVGLPEYERFWQDVSGARSNPEFLGAKFNEIDVAPLSGKKTAAPMFLDDVEPMVKHRSISCDMSGNTIIEVVMGTDVSMN